MVLEEELLMEIIIEFLAYIKTFYLTNGANGLYS